MRHHWKHIEYLLKNDLIDTHRHIRDLAPRDSRYKGMYKGMLVDYIMVNNNPIFSNTNNLYNSVEFKFQGDLQKGGKFLTFVSTQRVPYYDKAVLEPEIRTFLTWGTRDYGDMYYPYYSVEDWKENRNYLYYMRGESFVKQTLKKWDKRSYKINGRMDDFR